MGKSLKKLEGQGANVMRTPFLQQAFGILFLLFSVSPSAQAHRPIFSEKAATDPNSAVVITQPAISQVIYREITEEAKQVWLAFDANKGFGLLIQVGVPALDRLKDFRPAMLVVGPGLPEKNIPFDLPEGSGAKDFPTDSVKEPRFFHEHFTGTDSWILRSDTVVLPNSGRYYLVAYVPSGEKGKLWISVSKKEVFGLGDWAEFGEWKKRIRKFHEVSEEDGGLRIPILSEIGDLLRSAGTVRSTVEKPDSSSIEADSVGSCYYIDPVNGSDEDDGNSSGPWKSFRNIYSHYQASYRPAGWVDLKPGDCIVLKEGVYSEVFHPGEWQKGQTGGGSFVAYFRGRKGDRNRPFTIKAFPGHKPIIDPKGKGIGLSIFQSSHWQVEGIEIRNAYGRGMNLNESQEVKVSGVHIHDTDGVDNNNIAGLYINDCWNVEISKSVFNDNYDRTCTDTNGRATENSSNIVIFGGMRGGNITIDHCHLYQSLPLSHNLSGGGIKYKHASRVPVAYFNVHHNKFENCKFFAFGSGTANTHFHHNLIVGGAGISSRDFGGVTHQVNQIFEYNTLYDTSGFDLRPTFRWRNEEFPDDPKNIVFRNNVVYDTRPKYSNEHGVVVVGTYMNDERYRATVPELTFKQNCYYNPNTVVQFNMAAGFNYKDGYREGGVLSLEQWQQSYGYDEDSIETDPMFVDVSQGLFQLNDGSPCTNMGACVGDLQNR